MERPGLAAAIGCVSGAVLVLALLGVLDTSAYAVVLMLVAVRCTAAVVDADAGGLRHAAVAAVPLATLAAIGALRSGSAALEGIRGANAVLGPAIATRPGLLAAAAALAGIAVLATAPTAERAAGLARSLEVVARIGAALFVTTVIVGPTLDGPKTLPVWTASLVAVCGAMLLAASIRPRRLVILAAMGASAGSLLLGALA